MKPVGLPAIPDRRILVAAEAAPTIKSVLIGETSVPTEIGGG